MQTYTKITNDFTGAELPGKIDENLNSIKSNFSGTAFPTENLVEGMTCYRTDLDTEYKYIGGAWKVSGIATQVEAENGTNDTKVMTPKGVDYRLNKDRAIKTYTSLSSLGLSYESTIVEICETLPANSMLTFYVSALASSANYLKDNPPPTSGLLEIVKGANTSIPVKLFLSGQNAIDDYYGIYTIYNNLGFSGWKGIAFKENDVIPVEQGGTNANTVDGVRNNLNVRVQTFTALEQLGLSDAATPVEIARALPENSELNFYARSAVHSNLGNPINGSCRIEKRSTAGYVTVNFFLYAQTSNDTFYGVYSSYNNVGFTGWNRIMLQKDAFYIGSDQKTMGEIVSGDDLNTYVNAGTYLCRSSDIAKSLLNCPHTTSNFRLIVIKNLEGYVFQMIFPTSSKRPYTRALYSSGTVWSEWGELATKNALSMPSSTRIIIEKGVTSYTAPTDGWLCIYATATTNYANIEINNGKNTFRSPLTGDTWYGNTLFPCRKNEVLSITYNNCTTLTSYFYSAQSEV